VYSISRREFLKLAGLASAGVVLSPFLKACQSAGLTSTGEPTLLPRSKTPYPSPTVLSTQTPTAEPTLTATAVRPKYDAGMLTPVRAATGDMARCRGFDDFEGFRQDWAEARRVIEEEVLPGLPENRFLTHEHVTARGDRARIGNGGRIEPVMAILAENQHVVLGFPAVDGEGKRFVISAALIKDPRYPDSDKVIATQPAVLEFLRANNTVPNLPNANLTLGLVSARSVSGDTPLADKLEEIQGGSVVQALRDGVLNWVIGTDHKYPDEAKAGLATVAFIQRR
jgi:hypothetical protein